MEKTHAGVGGYTDSRGEWRPEKPISFAPVFTWPPKLGKFLTWLLNYLFTWNLIYLGVVMLSYYFLQPPLEEMKVFKVSWISTIFIRNMALIWIVAGGWHLYLYTFKKRGTKAKYNPRWQSTTGSTFLWNNQVYDNIFWTCVSGVPIWTAFEALSFWLYANGKLPYLDPREHPFYFILIFLLIPFWREFHFYLIHRLIHWKPLYNKIHYLHHYNINPGPWSGISMHPLEHLLYFTTMLVHWIIPSHPLHLMFNSQHAALTPAPGHTGFEGKLGKFLPFGSYFHYLHHRLFECNYGEVTIPMDKWFGIFDDGSLTQTEKFEAASAYQKLRVSKIIDESPEVKSFYLSAVDDAELKQNIPGQHLIFRFPFQDRKLCPDVDGAGSSQIKYALRSYTISNGEKNDQYRISVKNEPGGFVSPALHSSLKVGDVIEAKGPKGLFVLQQDRRKPAVFIAAGIGITPILSMLKSIDKTNAERYLILAAKEENLLSFKEEIHQISKDHPNIKVHLFFSRKPAVHMNKEYSSWQYHSQHLDPDSLKAILPHKNNFRFYICGPEKMTASLMDGIKSWKGIGSVIHTESFGTQKKSKNQLDSNKEIQVHFTKSDITVAWDHEYANILEFAESNGVSLEAGCMFGECGACSTKMEKGSVDYNYQTAIKPVQGNCLPCSCFPTSDIRLEG